MRRHRPCHDPSHRRATVRSPRFPTSVVCTTGTTAARRSPQLTSVRTGGRVGRDSRRSSLAPSSLFRRACFRGPDKANQVAEPPSSRVAAPCPWETCSEPLRRGFQQAQRSSSSVWICRQTSSAGAAVVPSAEAADARASHPQARGEAIVSRWRSAPVQSPWSSCGSPDAPTAARRDVMRVTDTIDLRPVRIVSAVIDSGLSGCSFLQFALSQTHNPTAPESATRSLRLLPSKSPAVTVCASSVFS